MKRAKPGLDARAHLASLTGRTIGTLTQGKPNRILRVDGSTVVVASERTPSAALIEITDVQAAFDRLAAGEEVEVSVESLGHRSAFVGAVLGTLPGATVLHTRPKRVRLAATRTPDEIIEDLGVRGVLRQLARDGQLIDIRCEMPQCYCTRGRRHFDPRSARASDWEPTADHYPRLKAHGGHLSSDNVRLAHRLCNRRDFGWRMKINRMLGKRMSLQEIADALNSERVAAAHDTNRWTAASVRKAFVS